MTKYITAAIVLSVVVLGFKYGTSITSSFNSGIHIISPNAVYLAGEACTVNMHLERSEEEIQTEMLECVQIHRTYVESAK